MKIASSLRELYLDAFEMNRELQGRVTRTINVFRNPRWHYESRLKSEESYALKVESGAVADPSALEDFTACTLVVPNLKDVGTAELLVCEAFELIERRPRSREVPQGPPDSFLFDDLRLYLKMRTDDALPPEKTDGIVFEVQVKTFLDHAWSVATHDTIYKTTSLSWPRERIAHQVKAMLEHAELTIDNVSVLENTTGLPSAYERYVELSGLISILRREWPDESLPDDLKRLASSVLRICKSLGTGNIHDLALLLEHGRTRYGGSHNADWSPYRATTEYLVDEQRDQMVKLVCSARGRNYFLHSETIDRLGVPAGRRVFVSVA